MIFLIFNIDFITQMTFTDMDENVEFHFLNLRQNILSALAIKILY